MVKQVNTLKKTGGLYLIGVKGFNAYENRIFPKNALYFFANCTSTVYLVSGRKGEVGCHEWVEDDRWVGRDEVGHQQRWRMIAGRRGESLTARVHLLRDFKP